MSRTLRATSLTTILALALAVVGCADRQEPPAANKAPEARPGADSKPKADPNVEKPVESAKVAVPDKDDEASKPLTEAALLKLIELQPDERGVVARMEKQGLAFEVDDAALERFKKAGAPPAVLVALQAPKSDKLPIMLWCEWNNPAWGTPNLHSDISINGKGVDKFTGPKSKDVGGMLKQGWNTITMKTPAGAAYGNGNYFQFNIGPVHKDQDNKPVMSPVLWSFTNGLDWQDTGGKWTHQSDPDAKEVTLTFTVYLGQPELEKGAGKKGDYILRAWTFRPGATQPVSTTVRVNGTTLTSFVASKRDIVITPLLKKGKNVVEIVTHRVPNVIFDWNSTISVAGPGEWIAAENEYQFKEVVTLNNLDGWVRDKKSGKWLNTEKPEEETVKRVLTFNLDEDSKGK